MNTTKTLQDAIDLYQENQENPGLVLTAIYRYTLPGLGFTTNLSARLKREEKIKCAAFCRLINLSDLKLQQLLDAQTKTLDSSDTSKANKRQQKKNLNKFTDYLLANKFVRQPDTRVVNGKKYKIAVHPVANKKVANREKIQEIKGTRPKQKASSFTFNSEDYAGDISANLIELDRIKQEFEDFKQYLKTTPSKKTNRVRAERTIIVTIEYLLPFLSWLQKENSIQLKNIGLSTMIPFVPVPCRKDFDNIEEYYYQRGIYEENIEEECNRMERNIQSFFSTKKLKRNTKRNVIIALTNLACYLYRKCTKSNYYQNFEDIMVIVRLRKLKSQLPKEPKKIEPEVIDWELILRITENLRLEASDNYYYTKSNEPGRNIREKRLKKPSPCIARHYHLFLIFAFLTLIPPSRIRVLNELEIGRTLKHGLFDDYVFTPASMLDTKKAPKYYIHLMPDDYKTGNIYGEWLAELPNIIFSDGTTFYSYIDRWIAVEREVLINRGKEKDSNFQEHNFFFLQPYTGKPQKNFRSGLGKTIARITKNATGEQIYPHKFRTIYRTYLANCGATTKELESAAFWMRHSSEVAIKIYTKQSIQRKLNPCLELNKSIIKKSIGFKKIRSVSTN